MSFTYEQKCVFFVVASGIAAIDDIRKYVRTESMLNMMESQGISMSDFIEFQNKHTPEEIINIYISLSDDQKTDYVKMMLIVMLDDGIIDDNEFDAFKRTLLDYGFPVSAVKTAMTEVLGMNFNYSDD